MGAIVPSTASASATAFHPRALQRCVYRASLAALRDMAAPFTISGVWDSRQTKAALAALAPRQWAFVKALALTRTASTVKGVERATARDVFDRATPWTLNALWLKPATKTDLTATVKFKDEGKGGGVAGHYLLPEVHGGDRRHKRFESRLRAAGLLPQGRWLIPGEDAPLDAYGNVRRSIYPQVLSQLRAQGNPRLNESRAMAKRRNANPKKLGGRYFYGKAGKDRGIFERFQFAVGSTVRPIFIETSRAPHYRELYPFFDVAETTVAKVYESAFADAVNVALRTSR